MIQTRRPTLAPQGCGRGTAPHSSSLDDGTCVTRSHARIAHCVSLGGCRLSACNSLVRQMHVFRIRRPNHRTNAFSRLFHTLAADGVRHRLRSTSRVNAALSRCFMLASLSIWARIIRWERASGSCLHCCVVWVESRAAVRATPVHEPWALAASNLESLALGLH